MFPVRQSLNADGLLPNALRNDVLKYCRDEYPQASAILLNGIEVELTSRCASFRRVFEISFCTDVPSFSLKA